MAISVACVLAFEAAGVGKGGEMTTAALGWKLDPIRERRTLCAPCETSPGPTLVRVGGETDGGAEVTRKGCLAVTGGAPVAKVAMTCCGPTGALGSMETVALTCPTELVNPITVIPTPGLNCKPVGGSRQAKTLAVKENTAP